MDKKKIMYRAGGPTKLQITRKQINFDLARLSSESLSCCMRSASTRQSIIIIAIQF